MAERVIAAMKVCLALLALLLAQSPPPRPTFEVASIKRSTFGTDGARFNGQVGRVTVTNNSLRNIIRNAWGLQAFQIVGGPDWINNDRWDIVAKAEGNPQGPEMLAMVQNLLADRFKLVVHRETREMPIYALVLAKPDRALGPKLRASSIDCQKEMTAAIARGGGAPPRDGKLLCGIRIVSGHLEMNAVPMTNFARNISPIAGRSVVDKTGLTGDFDGELTWTPDASLGAPQDGPPPANDGPSLFTAMQEQLGLKLDAQRGPVEVLVIDSVDRPTED
jgi:uncharacterized protein (TIGR03435 family)